MGNWKTCTIADLGMVVGGATPSTKEAENYDGGTIAWITPKDLAGYSGRFISHGERDITEIGLHSCSAQMMPRHSVLFSSRAPIGYVAIAENELCTNQGFKSIVPNENTDYMFLYYLLLNNRQRIEHMGSGTTFKEVSGKTMRSIEVRVPESKEEQIRISSILSTIDDKIEENERINKNLSDQLQALYSSEFDPMMYPVTGKLSDICHYSSERVNVDQLTTKTYYSTENMQPNKASAVEAANLPNIKQTTKCHAGDVLVSNIRPYFKKIEYVTTACGCSADVLCFVPESNELSAFLYETVYGDRFFDYMVAGSKGTKMPRGDKQQIMQYGIVMPSPEQLSAFNAIATPMLALIGNQVLENERLSTLRDSLLPKLVSGEIDVSGIEL